jgi:uncharacterized short protein YbdD (DUF466 family)
LKEESSVGGGAIAGVGVDASSPTAPSNFKDPPVSKKNQRKHQEQNASSAPIMGSILRRPMLQVPLQELETGQFAGHKTIKVESQLFHKIRNEKRRYARWMDYLGEDDYSRAIRHYANKNPHKPICLEDKSTGYMCYARYGKKST